MCFGLWVLLHLRGQSRTISPFQPPDHEVDLIGWCLLPDAGPWGGVVVAVVLSPLDAVTANQAPPRGV